MDQPTRQNKAAVIGCGFVGSTCAYSLMQSKLFSELTLIDVDTDRAEGEALDISHGVPYYSPMSIKAGTYDDLADANVVVIAAGANQQPGETRLDLVHKNVAIFKSIVPEIKSSGFSGIIVVVSNPVDVLTQVTIELSGLPHQQVIGSGTVLDSARLKFAIGQKLGVDPRHVHASVIGEHGDSELVAWSLANVSGVSASRFFELRGIKNVKHEQELIEDEVRNSAYEIIKRKHATYFGIAPSVARICEAIVRDEKSVLTVSNWRDEIEGVHDVTMSLPAIIGAKGAEFRVPLELNDDESARLRASARTLRETLDEAFYRNQ